MTYARRNEIPASVDRGFLWRPRGRLKTGAIEVKGESDCVYKKKGGDADCGNVNEGAERDESPAGRKKGECEKRRERGEE